MSQKEYLAGLKDYWSGRPRTAIEHISKVIVDNPDQEYILPMYRLWIELLASEEDRVALRSLSNHLFQRAEGEDEYRNSFFALRGIIDFELDEIQNADLKLAALKNVNNMYVWELKYKLASRCGLNTELYSTKKSKEAVAFDFVFAKSYLLALSKNRRQKDFFAEISQVLDNNYPENPLTQEISLHQAVDNKDYASAFTIAQTLCDRFPAHPQYAVQLAYLSIKTENFHMAQTILARCESMFGSDDLDVACLTGMNNYYIYKSSNAKTDKERCIISLKKAGKILEQNGYSRLNFSKMYHEVVNTLGSLNREMKSWMVHLTQREFADLLLREENEIRQIEECIGENAEVGDLVFMVAHDSVSGNNETQFRLGAVYQVSSETVWDPIDGRKTLMNLVSKPSVSIKLPVQMEESDQSLRSTRYVFAMNDEAFDQVFSTIEGYANDESSISFLMSELERIRQVS